MLREEAWVLQGYILMSGEVFGCPEQDSWMLQEGAGFPGELLVCSKKVGVVPRRVLTRSTEMLRTCREMLEGPGENLGCSRDILMCPGEGGACVPWECPWAP